MKRGGPLRRLGDLLDARIKRLGIPEPPGEGSQVHCRIHGILQVGVYLGHEAPELIELVCLAKRDVVPVQERLE